MPYDGTDFDPTPLPPKPPRRRLSKRGESVVIAVVALLAVGLLILPVSADALIDIVHYLRHPLR